MGENVFRKPYNNTTFKLAFQLFPFVQNNGPLRCPHSTLGNMGAYYFTCQMKDTGWGIWAGDITLDDLDEPKLTKQVPGRLFLWDEERGFLVEALKEAQYCLLWGWIKGHEAGNVDDFQEPKTTFREGKGITSFGPSRMMLSHWCLNYRPGGFVLERYHVQL